MIGLRFINTPSELEDWWQANEKTVYCNSRTQLSTDLKSEENFPCYVVMEGFDSGGPFIFKYHRFTSAQVFTNGINISKALEEHNGLRN